MIGTSAGRSAPADATCAHAASAAPRRRGLRRLFVRAADPERSSRRAGGDPFPVVVATPRVWVALG